MAGAMLVTALLAAQSAPPLPEPFATPWFRKSTRVVPLPDGHTLTVPAGFTVSLFADKLQMARFMTLAPNGGSLPEVEQWHQSRVESARTVA